MISNAGSFKSSMKAIQAPAFLTTTIFILWSWQTVNKNVQSDLDQESDLPGLLL